MTQALVPMVTGFLSNNSYGSIKAQGCSGNGQVVACLFSKDNFTDAKKGTLKLIDAKTLNAIWGSSQSGGVDLAWSGIFAGEVPSFLPDGSIVAGDNIYLNKYDINGKLIYSISPLPSTANNMGLTLINDGLGVVSQTDGTLTLIDLNLGQILDSKKILDMKTGEAIKLVSPSTGSLNTIYSVGKNSVSQGYLFSIHLDPSSTRLEIGSQFKFDGPTGASAVILKPTQTGLSSNLILLHSPGINGDGLNHLLGILEQTTSLQVLWNALLPGQLVVSPTIDDVAKIVYLVLLQDANIYSFNFADGTTAKKPINVASLLNLSSGFKINGHMSSSQTGGKFSILVAGSIGYGAGIGQYVVAVNPSSKLPKLIWGQRIAAQPMSGMSAWNASTYGTGNVNFCPLVSSPDMTLTRICDDY